MKFLSGSNASKCALFAVMLTLAAVELFALHWLQPVENQVLDAFVRQHARDLVPDPEVVIVTIDDASLASMEEVAGNWPWPREVHGDLLRGILRQKPKAIVFDLAFTERDVYRPDSDRRFNEALAGNTNIYFPLVRLPPQMDQAGDRADEVAPLLGLKRTARANPEARVALHPPKAVDAAYWRTGTINFSKENDGIGRRYDLYLDADGWQIPSLPARVAADLGYKIPAGPDMLLAWRGAQQGHTRIPYAALYQDFEREHPRRLPNELTGKIVVVGSDASTMNDLRATPLSSLYPGVQILATAIDNLKNQRFMHRPPAWTAQLGGLALMLMLLWAFVRGENLVRQVGLPLATLTLTLVLAMWLAVGRLVLLPIVSTLIMVWAYYFAGALQTYLSERESRQAAMQMFSRFVNPHVVQQLVSDGGLLREGESREISVLFSDIRGFTTLSENRSPQEVVQLLNRYFTLQVEVVFRHGGTMDKFIGDCIMAFWGAPLDDPRHAENAVLAALEMAVVLQRFKAELGREDADFDVGIGVHSGPAVVGLIGSEQRLEYTAIGDTVNLASRIEGLTKGVARILVSEETMAMCGPSFSFTPYGAFEVKGRAQHVNLFGPVQGEKKK
ncbi:MAG: adenylate/guanylate cyclase domain-containing protein [Pseudomonadota bacterium]